MEWKIIRTESQYQAALSRLEEIFDYKKGDPAFDKAELLVILIERYESEKESEFNTKDLN